MPKDVERHQLTKQKEQPDAPLPETRSKHNDNGKGEPHNLATTTDTPTNSRRNKYDTAPELLIHA